MKKALILASVASMIDQFNRSNIAVLKELGYEVHVAANFEKGNTTSLQRIEDFKKELEEMSVPYYQIDFSRNVYHVIHNYKAYHRLLELLSENKYEFVHCHSPIGGVCGRLAANKTNTKVIYTAHGFHFYRNAPLYHWMVYYPTERFLAKFTDILITINKEDFATAQNFKAKKVIYVPGIGIETSKYKSTPTSSEKVKKKLAISGNKVVLLSVGELSKRKNHEIIIRALSKLNNENIVYLICGQGRLEDHLKNIAIENNVDVRLLGYRTDIPEIYSAADIFVFPSLQEGLPVALMEAMAAGLPVICSDIRGNSDLIEDNVGGYVIDKNDTEGYEAAIARLISNYEIRQQMKQQNQIRIEDFDLSIINKMMRQVYEEI
jgi:glycosyltransferase involved in cell wall biosynthesis